MSPSAPKRPSPDSPERSLLRDAGMRATPQRLAVLRVLRRAGGDHLSADDVWEKLRRTHAGMDRSTAYRILASLVEVGILNQARFPDGVARFEITETAHHHAVCTRCGATVDIPHAAMQALARTVVQDSGFHIGEQPQLLAGLCRACAA